ncbi:DUF4136 domain-containing protein [Glaciecola petra]|uniref:DUF4136 domain-containing protein n=1 Tax=Glaciecola petra TaxID=3075602 RepID=A0ABU2ZQT4_9ALTE|nr:DUF4136 domain-containing protein [Aestuariibacter sp. P117]MDT0594993.1 DUF4136 domain-containing protein [Aestuariibacter sp. P117]
MSSVNTRLLICFGFILSLASCSSSAPISYQFGYKQVDFDNLKTYRWKNNSAKSAFPELSSAFVSNLNESLSTKGYQQKDQGPVDFFISYEIKATTDVNLETFQTYEGTGLAFKWNRSDGLKRDPVKTGGYDTNAEVSGRGTVVVDFIDPNNNTVFWRGVAEKEFETDANSGSPNRLVDVNKAKNNMKKAVHRLMEFFPPEK